MDDKVFPLFESAAKKLMEEMGPLEAISAALACLTGHTKELRSRSLLSNSDDFVTCGFKSDQPIMSTSYVWTALKRVLPLEVTEETRGMQMTADDMGAVFDVPSKYMNHVKKACAENNWVYICTELPALKQIAQRFGGGGGGFGGGGGGFRMGRGGKCIIT